VRTFFGQMLTKCVWKLANYDFAPPRARSVAPLPMPSHPVGAARIRQKRNPPTGASWNIISGRAGQHTAGAGACFGVNVSPQGTTKPPSPYPWWSVAGPFLAPQ
jgi:hypothetical protein